MTYRKLAKFVVISSIFAVSLFSYQRNAYASNTFFGIIEGEDGDECPEVIGEICIKGKNFDGLIVDAQAGFFSGPKRASIIVQGLIINPTSSVQTFSRELSLNYNFQVPDPSFCRVSTFFSGTFFTPLNEPLATIRFPADKVVSRAKATSCYDAEASTLLIPTGFNQPVTGSVFVSGRDSQVGRLSPPSGVFTGEFEISLNPGNGFAFRSTKEDVLVSTPESSSVFPLLALVPLGLTKLKKVKISPNK